MSSLERVVERLVEVRFVECPYCDLRVTVKNPEWKRVTCKGCGHKINVPFSRQYVDVKKVLVEELPPVKRLLHPPLPPVKELLIERGK